MRFQSCQLSEMASLIHQFPLLPKSHVRHTRDKQHVWFWQKIIVIKKTEKRDNSSLDKVLKDDDERWSLYTKRALTFAAILVWLFHFCSKAFPPPTRFISCSKRWMLKPQPHDVVVPKRGAIVKKTKTKERKKNHGTRLPLVSPWPHARQRGGSFVQQARLLSGDCSLHC